jgi:hypothetical protein
MATLRSPPINWQDDTGTNPETAMEVVLNKDIAPPDKVSYTGGIIKMYSAVNDAAGDPGQGTPILG